MASKRISYFNNYIPCIWIFAPDLGLESQTGFALRAHAHVQITHFCLKG